MMYAEIMESFTEKFDHHVSLRDLVQDSAAALADLCSVPLAVAVFRDPTGQIHFSSAGTLAADVSWMGEQADRWIADQSRSGPIHVLGDEGDRLAQIGVNSFTGIPVNLRGEVPGMLMAFSFQTTPPEQEMIRLFALQVGPVARRCWLRGRERQAVQQFQEVHNSLMEHKGRLQRVLLMQRQFTDPKISADGFDSLVGMLGEILGGPLVLLDRVLRVLASYTPRVSLDGSWVRSLEERRLAPEFANRPALQNALRRLLWGEERFISVESSPDLEGTYWLGSLCSGENVWGFLLWRGDHLLDQEQQQALQLAGSALTLAYFHQLQGTISQRPSFLESFLSGRYISTEAVMEQARREGCDLSKVTRLILIEVELQNQSAADILFMVEGAIASYGFGTYAAVYADSIVLLLENDVDAKSLAKVVLERIRANGISTMIGVSRPFRDPEDIRIGYDEVRRSLILANKLGKQDTVLMYEELGVYRVLLSLDRTLLEEIIEHALGPLLRQEQSQASELLLTLVHYIRSGGSLQQAAEQCFIHLNTVKYRLKRINQLLEVDLASPENRFQLDFALRALEIRDL